jgi:hypothetical protein
VPDSNQKRLRGIWHRKGDASSAVTNSRATRGYYTPINYRVVEFELVEIPTISFDAEYPND